MKDAKIITRMAEEARALGERILAGELSTVAGALEEGYTSRALELLTRFAQPMEQLQQHGPDYQTRRTAGRLLIIYRTALEIIREESQA